MTKRDDLFFETIAALLLAYDDEEHGEPLHLADCLKRIVEWQHLPHEGDCSKAEPAGSVDVQPVRR